MPELGLAGFAELAELLGVTKRTVQRYTVRSDFPQPVARLAAGPVWLEDDVLAWWATYVPAAGGRPRSR